jgi:hypothetical protein
MENRFLTLSGRRFPFGPLAKAARSTPHAHARPRSAAARPTPRGRLLLPPARPTALSRPRQSALAAWRPHAEAIGHVAPGCPRPPLQSSTLRSAPPIPFLRSFAPFLSSLEKPSGRTTRHREPSPPPPRSDNGKPPPSDCLRTVLRFHACSLEKF